MFSWASTENTRPQPTPHKTSFWSSDDFYLPEFGESHLKYAEKATFRQDMGGKREGGVQNRGRGGSVVATLVDLHLRFVPPENGKIQHWIEEMA
jgi:hypothetical protein